MDPKPFVRLSLPRVIDRPDLPPDLARFFADHEGRGLESDPIRVVRFCLLDEIKRGGWPDFFGSEECAGGWEDFDAILIGANCFGHELYYVVNAPSCANGAILELDFEAGGPGGSGPYALEGTLVLAASFQEWLRHMEEMNWNEYGICGTDELSEAKQREMRDYYDALNRARCKAEVQPPPSLCREP